MEKTIDQTEIHSLYSFETKEKIKREIKIRRRKN
jgi:hypothetical protein